MKNFLATIGAITFITGVGLLVYSVTKPNYSLWRRKW